ncbi:MAG: hypothetical protein ACE5Z5_15150 [Candidatus Bathyarchaeia archaeon]
MSSKRDFNILGKRTVRKDGIAKVTGREPYASDISLPNMLYARVLKSPYPHARVKSIDISKAEGMGAVVITFREIPVPSGYTTGLPDASTDTTTNKYVLPGSRSVSCRL